MRHFPHHIGDYAAHTAHLTFVEDAAYHRLLRRYYQDENPLPVDVAAVQRLVGARAKEERTAVETVLREFFVLQEDGWHQSRADQEIAAYLERAETARENGKRSGGRPKTKRVSKSKPADNQPGYSRDTQPEPSRTLTNNQEPVGKAPTGLSPEEHQTPSLVAARGALEAPTHGDAPGQDSQIVQISLKRMPA